MSKMTHDEVVKAIEALYGNAEDHYEMKSDKKFYVVIETDMDRLGEVLEEIARRGFGVG